MRSTNQSSFTGKMLELEVTIQTTQPQTEVTITGPGTQFIYNGFGKMSYNDQNTGEQKDAKFKNIGVITHCSAITTTYSLIESIAMNYDNQTGISLLWLGDKQEDFVFLNQFAEYVRLCKLNLNVMLTGFRKGWIGPYGKVMKQHIDDFMPPPGSNSMILMSGLEGDMSHIPSLIKEMGYKDYLSF